MIKRALIAASVAAAFAAPAFAEVVIYGSIRTGVEYGQVSNDATTATVDRLALVDQLSRLGFKGSDKLDNGMKLVWKAENKIRIGSPGSSTGDWGGRDTFIGIESANLGTLTFGKQVDAYGDWTVLSPVLDGAMINSEDSYIYQADQGGRKSNLAKYASPTFGGAQVVVSYDFGTKAAAKAADATTTPVTPAVPAYNTYGYSTLLTWSNDTFNAGGSVLEYKDAGGTAGDTQRAYALGGGVKVASAWTISGHAERATKSASDYTRDDYGLGVNYAAGKWGMNAQYLKAKESKLKSVAQNDGADQFNIGARYALSKQTTAFASYTLLKNDKNGAYSTATGYGAKGDKLNVLAVSLRTDF